MLAFASLPDVDRSWWVIAAGFLLLAMTVVVFARLRFIQTRPIRACILLSAVAHLLIFGSVQFLRLFDAPKFPGDNAIQFQLSFDDVTIEVDKEEPVAEPESEPLVTTQPKMPEIESKPEAVPEDEPDLELAKLIPDDEPPPLPDPSTFVMSEPAPSLTPEPPPELKESPASDAERTESAPLERVTASPDPVAPQRAETPGPKRAPEVAAPIDKLVPNITPDSDARMVAVPEAATLPKKSSHRDAPDSNQWRQVAKIEPQPRSRYRLRDETNRAATAKKHGGTKSTEEAVEAALKWLVKNQEREGHWSAAHHHAGRGGFVEGQLRQTTGIRADTGVTGLAMLALMGGGHTHQRGSHRKAVQAGLEYLISQQRHDGCMGGSAGAFAQMYCHGIATLALCEAYGMSRDKRIEPFTRRAVEYTVRSQHRTTGGWRYRAGDLGDTSQFGWQLMVIESARHAGISVPTKSHELTKRFLEKVSTGKYDGLASYRPGRPATVSMTAEALACRSFLGSVDQRLQREATDLISRHPPNQAHRNLYFWYYGTLALYQLDSEYWPTWNTALHNALIPTQRQRGRLAGSWDTDTVWGGVGGRVYTTAMAALCLEVYYRYVPGYEAEMARRQD